MSDYNEYYGTLLRHCRSLFSRWKGSDVRIWSIKSSPSSLSIKITNDDRLGNLNLGCVEPEYIQGPILWSDCDLEIERRSIHGNIVPGITIFDLRSGFKVQAGALQHSSNLNPLEEKVHTPFLLEKIEDIVTIKDKGLILEICRDAFNKWKGGDARLWALFTGPTEIAIKVTMNDRSGNLYVRCIEPTYIQGPFLWSNSNLQVFENHILGINEEGVTIVDSTVGFNARVHTVMISENVPPLDEKVGNPML